MLLREEHLLHPSRAPSCIRRKADAQKPYIALSSPERDLPTRSIFDVKPLSHQDASDRRGGCYTSEELDFDLWFGVIGLSQHELSTAVFDVPLGKPDGYVLSFSLALFGPY